MCSAIQLSTDVAYASQFGGAIFYLRCVYCVIVQESACLPLSTVDTIPCVCVHGPPQQRALLMGGMPTSSQTVPARLGRKVSSFAFMAWVVRNPPPCRCRRGGAGRGADVVYQQQGARPRPAMYNTWVSLGPRYPIDDTRAPPCRRIKAWLPIRFLEAPYNIQYTISEGDAMCNCLRVTPW